MKLRNLPLPVFLDNDTRAARHTKAIVFENFIKARHIGRTACDVPLHGPVRPTPASVKVRRGVATEVIDGPALGCIGANEIAVRGKQGKVGGSVGAGGRGVERVERGLDGPKRRCGSLCRRSCCGY